MDTRPIGVFDSGVGGLSILIELKKLLPKERFVFLADQKNVPYGEKTPKQLEKLTDRVTRYFEKEHILSSWLLLAILQLAMAETIFDPNMIFQ